MRIRLVHTLSLLLLGVILAAVVAFGGMLAWNLRSGFNDYMVSRDTERLEQFAALIAEHIQGSAGLDLLHRGELGLPDLLGQFAQLQGLAGGPPRRGPPGIGPPRMLDESVRPPPGGLPPGLPPAPPGPEPFGSRVGVYAPDGQLLTGSPVDADSNGVIQRPVVVHGKSVAWVRMRPTPLVADAVESAFLRRQYIGIAGIAAALVGLGFLGARWMAGRWVHPLLGIQGATAQIARGELTMRLTTTRTDEIGDLIGNINSMAEGLERLDGARRRWIAEISHELRTPLTVLRGELDALSDDVRPLNHSAVLSLREEVVRMGSLVDDLHLLAMADMNALPCYFSEGDAVQLVRRVLRRLESRASAKTIVIDFSTPDGAALPVFWDPQRMEQVLTNLLENSLTYTDGPGRVRLTIHRRGERVHLLVEDSKPGVPETELDRLFEPLYRSDAARGRHQGGSGLGLAICAALVRAHSGRITAAPSALGGLSILVDMPITAESPT